jgi:hypothetical protein
MPSYWCHLAEEFAAVGTQAGDCVVDVVDSEHDAMQTERAGRRPTGRASRLLCVP